VKNQKLTKEQLLKELDRLRKKVARLEAMKAKQAEVETALQERESLYRSFIEASSNGIAFADLQGKMVFCNRQKALMLGYSNPEELTGIDEFSLIAPEDRARAQSEFAKFQGREGVVRNVEFNIVRKDGSIFPAEFNGMLVKDKNGRPMGLMTIMHDITEQKRAAAAFQEAERKYRELVDVSLMGIYITQNHILKFCNQRMAEIFGYDRPEDVIGSHISQFILPESWPIVEQQIRLRESGQVERAQYQFKGVKKDGTVIDVGVLGGRILHEGQPAMQGCLIDITDHLRTVEQIRSALKEKEILLREIHHRVKNNMQIISSLLNLQSTQLKDKKDLFLFKETQNRIRSLALVHEKLYQSKNLSMIDFAEYIRSLITYLWQFFMIDSETIRLHLDLEEAYFDINTAIPCGLIVNELVSNILKHAFPVGRKGEVRIVLVRAEGNKFMLVVQDDGIGFPENLDFRKSETLGMQIVTMLVQQLDGTIELEREEGTTFKIVFEELKYKPRI
jgi:PAS domain S-box-containing protein